MMFNIELDFALDLSTRLVSCGMIFSAFEQLIQRKNFEAKGVFGLDTLICRHENHMLFHLANRYVIVLLILQAVFSIFLVVFGILSTLGRAILIFNFLTAVIIRWRRSIGGDGAEQMAMIVLIAAIVGVFPYPSTSRVTLAIFFIGAQLSLSYLTAGMAKLISPKWRSGNALPSILSTHIHGHQQAAALLNKNRWLALLICWSVIIFECLFPLLIVSPNWLIAPILILGLLFHTSCAFLMGLNSFLWIFPATYPSIIAAIGYIHTINFLK